MKIKTINIILFLILIFIIGSQLHNIIENADNQSPCDDVKKQVQEQKLQINELQQQIQRQTQEIQTRDQQIQTQNNNIQQQKYNSELEIHKNNTQAQSDFCDYAMNKYKQLEDKVQRTMDGLKKIK